MDNQSHLQATHSLMLRQLRYAQIEKEMLATVYAVEKSKQYMYGRPVTVESDHKPLQSIMKKPLRNAPKQLLYIRHVAVNAEIRYKGDVQARPTDVFGRHTQQSKPDKHSRNCTGSRRMLCIACHHGVTQYFSLVMMKHFQSTFVILIYFLYEKAFAIRNTRHTVHTNVTYFILKLCQDYTCTTRQSVFLTAILERKKRAQDSTVIP